MSLLRRILRIAATIPRLENFSRYLFIGPHPDDIEIGCGATIAKLAALGKDITFLICLDGRYGLDNAPIGTTPTQLVQIRQAEAVESAHRLGISKVHFLNFSDGGFYNPEDLRKSIAQTIGTIKPDILFSVDPDVPSECHIDHLNVGQQSKVVANFSTNSHIMARYGTESAPVKAIALYMTDRPNRFVKTNRHFLKLQLDAIFGVHLSQFPPNCSQRQSISLYLKLRSVLFGLRSLSLPSLRAESFRVLDTTRMHCLPEA